MTRYRDIDANKRNKILHGIKDSHSKEVKAPLFDRIIKPEVITLENGHTVERPRSRMPLILAILFVCIIVAAESTGFDFSILAKRIGQLGVILGKIFQPNFSYFPKVISPLIGTIKMSIVGTVIGCVTALPISIIASSNINKNRPTLLAIRFIISVVRSLPAIVYAYFFVLVFGLGTFAGSLAIAFFTFGIVAKMLYENIETIDMGPYEAMTSFGANTLESFWTACLPQILPQFFDNCLYCFELNVRNSSILGYVGAGGLGLLISERVGLRQYNDVGMILLTIFVVVMAIDLMNDYIRSKIV